MKLKCVIVDDEPLAINLLEGYLKKIPGVEVAHSFLNAIAASEYLRREQVDFLLLDIQMPDVSGLSLLKSLQSPPLTIFTTAHKQYAVDGYELNVIDYLLKPIDFERFEKSLSKVAAYLKYLRNEPIAARDAIYVNVDHSLVRIELDNIEYIESLDNYVKIHCTDKTTALTLITLKKILEQLPGNRFIRVHRSFIVAISKIRYVANRKITLTVASIPVGDTYGHVLKELLNAPNRIIISD